MHEHTVKKLNKSSIFNQKFVSPYPKIDPDALGEGSFGERGDHPLSEWGGGWSTPGDGINGFPKNQESW